jgi:hypothetical protein
MQAEQNSTGVVAAAPPSCIAHDIKVTIRPYQCNFWEFEGSRAQIEAERVIPPGTEWPEGAGDLYFNVGRFRYWLRRTRPEGMKGPRSAWTSGDWWRLRCDLIEGMDPRYLLVLDKERELADALHYATPAGQREQNVQWNRYWRASEDQAFQAFKAKFLPQRKKPSRRSKAAKVDTA